MSPSTGTTRRIAAIALAVAAVVVGAILPSAATAGAAAPSPADLRSALHTRSVDPHRGAPEYRPPRTVTRHSRKRRGAPAARASVTWLLYDEGWQTQAGFYIYTRWTFAVVNGMYWYKQERFYCSRAAVWSCSVDRIYLMTFSGGQWLRWEFRNGILIPL
jgi:hypothetical protein